MFYASAMGGCGLLVGWILGMLHGAIRLSLHRRNSALANRPTTQQPQETTEAAQTENNSPNPYASPK